MPLYEFLCGTCGPFDLRRDRSAAAEPAPCPSCGAPARRTFSVPQVMQGRRTGSTTGGEPRLVRREPDERSQGRPVVRAARGRPWEVGH